MNKGRTDDSSDNIKIKSQDELNTALLSDTNTIV